ncbi:MAG: rod shape-determining protein MreD [Mucilaginibacter polytrichastri]|nr:rod shape-determining protein MreD [Mucilaginibacter polytrichastri]
MTSKLIWNNFLRFFVLVFLQVFVLKNTPLYNLATPYLYILFILLLPFNIPNLALFALSFLLGITIDAFYDTPGLHAAACILLAFVRVVFMSITVERDDRITADEPTLARMGFRWFFIYTALLTLIHHFFLFVLETFRLEGFQYTLLRVAFSSVFTVILMLISGLLFYRRKER